MYESYTVKKMGQEKSDIAIVGTKGQIVIPQRFRKDLAIIPNTKIIIYRKDDKLVLAKLNVPPLEELKELFAEIDQQNKGKKKPTDQEILEEFKLTDVRTEFPKANKMVRVVIDTNVLVSALIDDGSLGNSSLNYWVNTL
jgi:AbrB family looped-hinge helix DNA binding protein